LGREFSASFFFLLLLGQGWRLGHSFPRIFVVIALSSGLGKGGAWEWLFNLYWLGLGCILNFFPWEGWRLRKRESVQSSPSPVDKELENGPAVLYATFVNYAKSDPTSAPEYSPQRSDYLFSINKYLALFLSN
jgi:hypothetical protein